MKTAKIVNIGKLEVGGAASKLLLMAGPCVIEGRDVCMTIAEGLKNWSLEKEVSLVFKASFDKANRTSIQSYRGPGLDEGLRILQEIKTTFDLPIVTDIHEPHQAAPVADVADVLQIPAFLCRQTDLLLAAGETGAVVSVKKAQFLAADDMASVVGKLESTGNRKIMLTERGSTFGYQNLVVDMRNLVWMREQGYPVIFDATHSVQRPGGGAGITTGDGDLVPYLASAAAGIGVDGFFMETHIDPAQAMSDRANLVPFKQLPALWDRLNRLHAVRHAD